MPLYSVVISCYHFLIRLAAFFGHVKAKQFLAIRKTIWPTPDSPFIWIHGASAGEGNQAIPLARALRKKYEAPIVLTVFSPSGLDFHQDSPHFDAVVPLPTDTKTGVRSWFCDKSILAAVFIRNELWWNYLQALHERNIPTFLVNTPEYLLQPSSGPYGYYLRNCLDQFDQIYAIHSSSVTRSHSSLIHGDTKWEYVQQKTIHEAVLPLENPTKTVVIGGSVWSDEWNLLKTWWEQEADHSRHALWLAPHEVDEHTLKHLEELFPGIRRYSSMESSDTECDLVLIDTMGSLSALYHRANIAVVGGGWHKSVHNVLEPAAAGLPVLIGPKHDKFPEVGELIREQVAFSYQDPERLRAKLIELTDSETERNRIRQSMNQLMQRANGLSERIAEDMGQWINRESADR